MGHAAHFLQRIERLTALQADFALGLYRNPDVIRWLLHKHAKTAERVAIALEHLPGGPHIILSSTGDFITCLGAGMSVEGAPIIARAELDRLMAEHTCLDQLLHDTHERGSLSDLFHRLLHEGPSFDREDMATFILVEPLMRKWVLEILIEIERQLHDTRMLYRPQLFRRSNPASRNLLMRYWRNSWALGHLITACGHQVRDQLCTFAATMQNTEYSSKSWGILSGAGARIMSTPMVLRGAWFAARGGKHLFEHYQDAYATLSLFDDFLDACLGITAIGLRHSRLRTRAHKTLLRQGAPFFQGSNGEVARAIVKTCALYLENEEASTAMVELHRHMGASWVVDMGKQALPEGHTLRFASAEEVPESVACALPVLMDNALFAKPKRISEILYILPWLAQADAESLYLPSEYAKALKPSPESVEKLVHAQLSGTRTYYGYDMPVRAEAKPGRNERCPCGSGVKYKRCCAGKNTPSITGADADNILQAA